jgi:predicted AlkP superfamily pyrophosphatase or phosphodiesterase
MSDRVARGAALAALACALACGCAGPPKRAALPTGPGVPVLPALAGGAEPERLVLVSIHGLRPDDYDAVPPAMPVLASLAAAGIRAEAVRPVFPPAFAPADVTLVTGLRPTHHGVFSSAALGPQGPVPAPTPAATVQGTPLWEAVRAAGGSVVALDWPATTGAPIATLAPDVVVPPGSTWPDALAAAGADRAAELARRSGGTDPAAAAPGAARDAALVTMACATLVGEASPRLVLVRLAGTAAALARAPAGSPAARAAFGVVDGELGRLVRCLGDAGLLATTALAVAGDHGDAPVHTAIRVNAPLVEAGLLVPAGDGVKSWDAIARSNGGSAFVYAADADTALLARRALEDAANRTRAFRVLSASEMVERGADPHAWFGLEADLGYVFSEATGSPLLVPAPVESAGGYQATLPAMTTGFVAWGPGLRNGLRVPAMWQEDVAPTVARWLGVPFGPVDGRVLVGLLANGGGSP